MARNMKWGLLALSLALAGCGGSGGGGGNPPDDIGAPPSLAWIDGPLAFDETLDAFDSTRWRRSDGWASSEDFNAGWRADHVLFAGGKMELRLDTEPCPSGCSSRPYASGELASTRFHGYGRYEVRMKPARGPGTMTSFSLTTGPFDWTRWDEIDMAFLGLNTRRFLVNYITDGQRHDTGLDLPFDAADDFHTYGIEWTRDAIHWYVDGKRVHTETGARGPLPSQPGRILTNFWPGVGPATESWMGHFDYPGRPLASTYEGIRHGPAAPTEVLEDFETTGTWAVTAEPGGKINTWHQEGHQGNALVMAYWVSSAQANIVRTFETPQDWSRVRFLNFWFRGTATGDAFRLELRDNGGADSAERFEYRFRDDFVGWKWVSVPMSSFSRRTDWQPAGAPNDGLTLKTVHGLAFQPLSGNGNTILLDDIQLERQP
ncbi:family 16 glycosylhydrolase [Archangium sp.]|uniref:family 16 glycosylhydrolase n=1 Tax=Archangium sp. TaxID=1872627 RepID=UPI002D70E970|nr:family 16 glycosylhydrolase [Archangium sp.]HYO52305.1 family 16 glycosylhydrolase [Archangium sp.]